MGKLELIDAETLYYKPLDYPKMLIDGLLSTGLAVLSGDSKIGKSWMVLWFCLKIAKGEPIWGIPTNKSDVVYLALEDRDYRLQQRMHMLTDSPPNNLFFGFSCGLIGQELETQIKEYLKEKPDVGIIFIDTFQKVRENVSSKVNAYSQDYQDLGALKKIADDHGICIFLVHHNRKERDSSNVFHEITGSTGIAGVADTIMVLRKDDHFKSEASLSITGRDIEERKLQLRMNHNVWEVTEEIRTDDSEKPEIPSMIQHTAEYFLDHSSFSGTMTDFLAEIGDNLTKPNTASLYISRYYNSVLKPLGIEYKTEKNHSGRSITLIRCDGGDDCDDHLESVNSSSYRARFMAFMAGKNGQLELPKRTFEASSSSCIAKECSAPRMHPNGFYDLTDDIECPFSDDHNDEGKDRNKENKDSNLPDNMYAEKDTGQVIRPP